MSERVHVRALVLAVVLLGAACTLPGPKPTRIAPDLSGAADPPSVGLLQQQLSDDARLDDVGVSLLRAAVPQCTARTRRAGFRLANVATFTRPWQASATTLAFTDTVQVVSVAKGSGADRAGVRAADRVVSIDGVPATPGSRIVEAMRARVATAAGAGAQHVTVVVRRDGRETSHTVPLDSSCALTFMSWRDDAPNAWSDGRTVAVTTGMLAYSRADDDLAVVLAHEIAHAVILGSAERSGRRQLVDASVDLATSAVALATDDPWLRMKGARPQSPASEADEQRADDLTRQLLLRTGHAASPHDFWRRLQLLDPAGVPYARLHPLSMTRIIRMDDSPTSR